MIAACDREKRNGKKPLSLVVTLETECRKLSAVLTAKLTDERVPRWCSLTMQQD